MERKKRAKERERERQSGMAAYGIIHSSRFKLTNVGLVVGLSVGDSVGGNIYVGD